MFHDNELQARKSPKNEPDTLILDVGYYKAEAYLNPLSVNPQDITKNVKSRNTIYVRLCECHLMGKLPYKGTGDVACDQYYKYKEDVQLMKKLGLDAYRFSISWSRLIPNGRGPVNPMGLQYYNNLIDELISNGIQPHVTLFHDDMPQVLEDEYQGWLSPKIVKDFKAYANVCFQEFGDRVLHWTTINEANVLALGGYDSGIFPPLRCSYPFGIKCTQGDSTLEPYIAAHHMLLAHAAAAVTYKKKYQLRLPVQYYTASRILELMKVNKFLNPLVFGDYPEIMKKNAGSKIPAFTHLQSKQIMGSFDFFGLNHYTTISVSDSPNILNVKDRDFNADMFAKLSFKQGGNRPQTIRSLLTKMWIQFPAVPSGLRKVLEYVKQVYGNPPIYIHENGFPGPSNETLEDSTRVEYLDGYIRNMLDAVRNGSNARGYFVWSFMDCFELLGGYEQRFGLYHVDFDDKDLKRYPKLSARWYSGFLRGEDVMGIEKIPDDPLQKSQFVG
ncbi:glycosyl hydrolase 1 [Asimina triloba]